MERADLVRRRLGQVGLGGDAWAGPEAVVGRLLAVQSQDFAPALWSIAQRLDGVVEPTLKQAFDDGRFLRTHVLRPTWHFVLPDDIRWLLALTAPRVHALNAPYYRSDGLDAEVLTKSVDVLGAALVGGAQLTRAELTAALAARGIEVERFGLAYVLINAELEGVVCSGALRGRQHTYALLDERAPHGQRLDRDQALAELALRYFGSHGPATVKDLAWWASLTMTDVQAGIAATGDELESVEVDGLAYWAAPAAEPEPADAVSRVFLLQGYDEYTVAYTQSKQLLNLQGWVGSFTDRPLYNGVLVLDSQVLGHWKRTVTKDRVVVETLLYRPFDDDETRALEAAADQLARYLDRAADLRVTAL